MELKNLSIRLNNFLTLPVTGTIVAPATEDAQGERRVGEKDRRKQTLLPPIPERRWRTGLADRRASE